MRYFTKLLTSAAFLFGLSGTAIAQNAHTSMASSFQEAASVTAPNAEVLPEVLSEAPYVTYSYPVYFDKCLSDGHKISIQVDTVISSLEEKVPDITKALKGAFMPLEPQIGQISSALSAEDILADDYSTRRDSLHNYFNTYTAQMGYEALKLVQTVAPGSALISFPSMSDIFFYEGLPIDPNKAHEDTGADFEFDTDGNFYRHGDCVPVAPA